MSVEASYGIWSWVVLVVGGLVIAYFSYGFYVRTKNLTQARKELDEAERNYYKAIADIGKPRDREV